MGIHNGKLTSASTSQVWATGQTYGVNDVVVQSSLLYICLIAHTSGTFSTDLAALKWVVVGSASGSSGINYVTNVGAEADTTGWVTYNDTQSFTVTSANPGVFTIASTTGYYVGMPITLSTTGVFSSPLGNGGTYYISLVVSSATFQVSTTRGGTSLNTTGMASPSGTTAVRPLIPVTATPGALVGLTFSRNTTTPLRGTGDFKLVQSNTSYAAGQGVYFPLTIDPADKAKVLNVSFDYNGDTNFAASDGTTAPGSNGSGDSDIEIFIYDVTNAILIPVAPQVITANGSNNFKFTGTFQTASNSTSYKLCFHGSRLYYRGVGANFRFDNVVLGPQIIVNAPTMSDWVDYTPTGSWSTNATYTGKWRRIGDSAEIKFNIALTGAPSGALTNIFIPSGMVIDTAKIPGTVSVDKRQLGFGTTYSAGTGGYLLAYAYESTTSVRPLPYNVASAYATDTSMGATTPGTYANGDFVEGTILVPIVGWSSNSVMSQDTDTRVVAARYYQNSAQAAITTAIQANFDTKILDTHAAVTTGAGAWKFTAPVAGVYRVSYVCTSGNTAWGAAGQIWTSQLFKNGSQYTGLPQVTSVSNAAGTFRQTVSESQLVDMIPGDFIDIRLTSSISTVPFNGAGMYISIERLSGPAVVAASEKIFLQYTGNAGTALTANVTNIDFATKVVDSHGAWNGTTFTPPRAGWYNVSGATNVTTGDNGQPVMYLNGSSKQILAMSATDNQRTFSTHIYLLPSDSITFRYTTTRTLNNAPTGHYISISSQG